MSNKLAMHWSLCNQKIVSSFWWYFKIIYNIIKNMNVPEIQYNSLKHQETMLTELEQE